MASFHLSDLARILGEDIPEERIVTGFEHDNRMIRPGNLFFCTKGTKGRWPCFFI